MGYGDILAEYMASGIIERMVTRGYALQPAKSAGYEGRRGAGYHVDMPLRTHVLNGLFSVTRLLDYLDARGIYSMPQADYRRLLAYFTTHDLHKSTELQELKVRGEFDIPLGEVEQELAALGIDGWADTTAAEHRVMMIHLPSPKVGDYADAPRGTSRLEPWVHVADALSSMQSAREFDTVSNYLQRILARELERQPLAFYWHELDDYRGISTLLLHQAVEAELGEVYQLHPLLYFPNGTLYVGPARAAGTFDVQVLKQRAVERLFALVQASLRGRAEDIARAAIRQSQGTAKFRADAFIFADAEQMVSALVDKARRKKAKHFLAERIGGAIARKKRGQATEAEIKTAVDSFCQQYMIPPEADQDSDFSTKWTAASTFVMGIESIASALTGDRSFAWLLDFYRTPEAVRRSIIANKKGLVSGGRADHAVIIAYHHLAQARFGTDRRPAAAVDLDVVLSKLAQDAVAALVPLDSVDGRLAYANRETGLQVEAEDYVSEHLFFSFAQARSATSPLTQAARRRSSGYGRLCSFCNRASRKVLKVDEASGIVATTFSNRRTPSQVVKEMQVWCPMCYLEFTLRERMGLGYARGYSKAASERLYLYLLPDYSFTPEFWQFARRGLLRPLESATKLKLRSGRGERVDVATIPNTWLLHGTVDGEWLGEVQSLFERAAEEMAEVDEKTGRARRDSLGEKMKLVPLRSPNFQLLVYESSVSSRGELAKRRAPTRTEMWAKAVYSASLLHLLLGVRVYVTDKPYLPLGRPDEMKHIIELDGPHPSLRRLLPRSGDSAPRGTAVALRDLKEVIDLLSAAWEVNAALAGGKGNLDKQIAGVLESVSVEPLAGAGFYKRRQADGYAVYPALLRACHLLLELRGGDKLSLVHRLTGASLRLFIPIRGGKREGKAHRYETMFRTAVQAVKASPPGICDDELEARVAGNLLKRVGRMRGGVVPLSGDALTAAAEDLARLVVRDLFRGRCGGRAAQLTHEENALADGIYCVTDRLVGQAWAEYKAARAAQKGEEDDNATR